MSFLCVNGGRGGGRGRGRGSWGKGDVEGRDGGGGKEPDVTTFTGKYGTVRMAVFLFRSMVTISCHILTRIIRPSWQVFGFMAGVEDIWTIAVDES